jgi:aldose 1-epimerase
MSSTVRLTSPDPGSGNPENGAPVVVDIDLAHGGRIGQITVGEETLLVDPPHSDELRSGTDGPVESVKWGSYPMTPWAGRVRDGRFRYFDTEYQLRLNQDDSGSGVVGRQHAMHGTVLDAAWTIDEQHHSVLAMSCPLDQPGSGWSFGGVAHQRIEVSGHQLRCDLSVSVDHQDHQRAERSATTITGTPASFPAEVGWHPWWRKPDALAFHPDAMYERDEVGLPTGQLVAPTAGPWDDCFVNTAPVTLHYDRESVSVVTISSDCDHWVVYDMPGHATCVEPQSGPPNAFNLRPQIVTGTHPLRRTMIVGWRSA